ncbi:hypothetical protein AAVH_34639, partial [Aphelenchoides avenae]
RLTLPKPSRRCTKASPRRSTGRLKRWLMARNSKVLRLATSGYEQTDFASYLHTVTLATSHNLHFRLLIFRCVSVHKRRTVQFLQQRCVVAN